MCNDDGSSDRFRNTGPKPKAATAAEDKSGKDGEKVFRVFRM